MRALFGVPDYRRLWVIGAVVGAARWLEFLAMGVFAFEVTGSPQLVALVAIARMLPYILFGFVIGAMADHLDRTRILQAAFFVGALISAAMAGLAALGLAGYGAVVFASIVSGVMWTTDMPVRRRLLVDATGAERMTSALGFDNSTSFATRALGPVIGGAAYQFFGLAGIFTISAAVYAMCFALSLRLDRPAASPAMGPGARPSRWALLAPPWELIATRPFVVIIGVTVVFNVWCFPIIAMVPVIGEKEFGLTPTAIGALLACEGIGGTVGAILVGVLARSRPLFRFYYFGVLAFLMLLVGMSSFLTLGVTILCLLLIGVASAGFSATQYALVYTMTPPQLRGRATGFLTFFIGTSTIGFYHTGYLFDRFDPVGAMRIMALEGFIVLAALGLLWLRAKR